jgi:hypothetical protein
MTKTIEVNAAPPSKLVFASAPVVQNDHLIATVQVTDRYGNITSAADGTVVTLKLTPGPARSHGPVLSGSLSVTVLNGLATFSDVTFTPDSPATLIASDARFQVVRSAIR